MDIIRIEFSFGSVITDTTDRYRPIIMVSGVGGDLSHTEITLSLSVCIFPRWSSAVLPNVFHTTNS